MNDARETPRRRAMAAVRSTTPGTAAPSARRVELSAACRSGGTIATPRRGETGRAMRLAGDLRAVRAVSRGEPRRAGVGGAAISDRLRVLGKPRHQVFHGPVAFDPIARAAQQLQVALVVGTATAARHHVVNLEHLERKLHLAAVALPFLLAEQYVAVLPVVDRSFNIGAPWRIRKTGPAPRRRGCSMLR